MSLTTALESLYQEELYQVPSRVLIVISKPWEEHGDEERTVLTKMLAAVKLNLSAVQFLVLKSFALEDVAALAPPKVLVFGTTFSSSPKIYEHIVLNGTSIIVADAIENLDDQKKKNLWGGLRQMFGV